MAAIHSGLAVTIQLRWEDGPRPAPSTALHRAPELAGGCWPGGSDHSCLSGVLPFSCFTPRRKGKMP